MKIYHLELTHSDREKLLSPVGWLNDRIIVLAAHADAIEKAISMVWRASRHNSRTDPQLSSENNRIYPDSAWQWIQTLPNNFYSWGWWRQRRDGVYDSLYPSVGTYIQKQIAALLHTRKPEITVHMRNMQMQAGTCDCALFAIAAASHSPCPWNSARSLLIQAEWNAASLVQMLGKGNTNTIFLYSRKEELQAVRWSIWMPFQSTAPENAQMVQCSRCAEWFHVNCVNPPQSAIDDSIESKLVLQFLLIVLLLTYWWT